MENCFLEHSTLFKQSVIQSPKFEENYMSQKTIEPELKEKLKVKLPKKYCVVFYNDDFTPFYFVEEVLTVIFGKSVSEAKEITNEVHNKGKAVAGIYNQEIANTKQEQTLYNAKKNGFPLYCEVVEE